MAGDAFSRFKNQVTIFFTVTVKKQLDTRTKQGRIRIAYLVALVLLLFLAVSTLTESSTETTELTIRANGLGGGGRRQLFEEDEEESDDDSGRLGGSNGLEEDDEEDDEEGGGGGGGDDEESDEGSSAALKSEQQARQSEMKADFTKFFEANKKESDIKQFLSSYVEKYRELNIIRSSVIGTTYEKRQLEVYSIGFGKSSKDIVVLGSEHGSEWSVPMYLTYIITRLVQLYGINDEVTSVLDGLTIHVIPFVNPDGAHFSMTSKSHDARHYGKNRAPVRKHSSIKGVDLREDWKSFTQLETRAIRDFVLSLKGHGLSAFIAVQCCAGAVVAPRNTTCVKEDALDEQGEVGSKVAREMGENMPHTFSFLKTPKPSTKSSKSTKTDLYSTHWAENIAGINLAFTLSAAPALPDNSKHSKKTSKVSEKKLIEIPEKELVIGSREITKGVVAVGKHLLEQGGVASNALCGAVDEEEPVGDSSSLSHDEDDDGGDIEDDESSQSHHDDEDDEDESRGDDEEDGDESDEEEGGKSAHDDEDDDDDEGAGHEAFNDDESDDEPRESVSSSSLRSSSKSSSASDAPPSSLDYETSKKYASRTTANRYRASMDLSKSSSGLDKRPEDFKEGRHDTENAIKYARFFGVSAPILENVDQGSIDGTGDHFLYFAYGPDMLYDLLYQAGVTSAVKVVNAQLDGYGFDYTYYSRKVWKSGIADLYKMKRGHVQGVVYRIHKQHRALLDRHNLAGTEDSHVAEVAVTVRDKRGNTFPCITYRVPLKMPGEDIGGKYRRFKPSRQYRNCIIKGAKQQHISEDYIEKRLRNIPPLYSDKIGSTLHRNAAIGDVCDSSKE